MWVKLDDGFADHPKIAKVGAFGAWLQVQALCYCNRNLTDGFIPWSIARAFGSHGVASTDASDRLWSLAQTCGMAGRDLDEVDWPQEMVDAGIWEVVAGGYRIHDYDQYQWSKAEVLAERKRWAERKQRQRARHGKSHGGTPAESHGPPVPVPVPVPVEQKKLAIARKEKRRSRTLPESETLTPERLRMAVACGLTEPEARRQWQLFALHEFKDPHSDWDRAWKKWCLNAVEYRRNARPPETGGFQFRGPSVEATRKRLAEIGR